MGLMALDLVVATAMTFGLLEQLDLISAAGTAVLSLLAVLVLFGIRWLHAKTGSDLLARLVRGVASAARLAVQEVWATYVKSLKDRAEDGKLTAEEKAQARALAIELVKSFIGAKGLALLLRQTGMSSAALDQYLGAFVETAIVDEKRTDRVTQPPPLLAGTVTPLPKEPAADPTEWFTENAGRLLAALRWDVDQKVINHDGEHVWLKPSLDEAGKRIGITDCCPVANPCERHARLEAERKNGSSAVDPETLQRVRKEIYGEPSMDHPATTPAST